MSRQSSRCPGPENRPVMKRFGHAVLLALAALAVGVDRQSVPPGGHSGPHDEGPVHERRPDPARQPGFGHGRVSAGRRDFRGRPRLRRNSARAASREPRTIRSSAFFRNFPAFETSHPATAPTCFTVSRRPAGKAVPCSYGCGRPVTAAPPGCTADLSEWTQNRWPVETGEPGP